MRPVRLVLVATAVVCAASCSPSGSGRTAAQAGSREGGEGTGARCVVRSDPAPITRRFPLFGTPRRAHWCGVLVNGGGGDRVPGPSDVRMVGVVELTAPAFAKVEAGMGAHPAAGSPGTLPAEVVRFLPDHATWLRSPRLDRSISRGLYTASFLVDRARRAVVLDCVDPEPVGGA